MNCVRAAEMLEHGARRDALLTMASGYDELADTMDTNREKLITLRRLYADAQRLIQEAQNLMGQGRRSDKEPPGNGR